MVLHAIKRVRSAILSLILILSFIFVFVPFKEAVAVETSFGGLTVKWQSDLSDAVLTGQAFNGWIYEFHYVSHQLVPGNILHLNVTVPSLPASSFQQYGDIMILTPWQADIIASVNCIDGPLSQNPCASPLSLSVAIAIDPAEWKREIWMQIYSGYDENYVTEHAMRIHIYADNIKPADISYNQQDMGSQKENKYTEFDGA